jgi:hypothetical protein
MAKEFSCKRCGYNTNTKCNLQKHLQRQKPCESILSTVDRQTLLAELERKYTPDSPKCDLCGKQFTTSSNLTRHRHTCTSKPTQTVSDDQFAILTEEIRRMKEELERIRTQPPTITNITNNITNNVQINLNNFGSETLDHLPDAKLTQCVLNQDEGVYELIKEIHFNPNVPQNKNIRLKSTKQNLLEKYYDGQWIPCDKNRTLDELLRNGYRLLYTHFNTNADKPEFQDKESILMEYFMSTNNRTCSKYYQLRRDVFVMIMNHTGVYLLGLDNQNNQ